MIQKQQNTYNQTKIDYNPYPSIKPLISKILKTKSQTKLKSIYFEVKFAKLKQNVSEQYQHFREDSKNQIIMLNSKPNFKQYNFKAGASEQQYKIVLQNLLKHTPPQKQIKSKSLKIILSQQQRLTRIFQNKNQKLWTFDQKKQQFTRQFKIIQNKKQFRINFCTLSQSKQLEDKINKEINGQIKSLIEHIRFVQNQFYTISQFYKMVLTKVYQPKLTEQFKQEIQTVYKQYDCQKLDQYILEHISQNKYPLHFEIETRLTEVGEKLMRILVDKPVKLNRFVGDMIKNTRNLADEEFKEIIQGAYQRQTLDIFFQEFDFSFDF